MLHIQKVACNIKEKFRLFFSGGGDRQEDFVGAASIAADFNWSKTATKILVAVADYQGREDFEVEGSDRKNITDVLFKLKCEIGVDAGLFLKTNTRSDLNNYADALKVNQYFTLILLTASESRHKKTNSLLLIS